MDHRTSWFPLVDGIVTSNPRTAVVSERDSTIGEREQAARVDRGHEWDIVATGYPEDWERYTFVETVYHPRNMTARQLDEAIYELRHAAANETWVWKRAARTLYRTRSLTTALFVHGMNQGWKRMARVQAPHDARRFGFTPHHSPRLAKIIDAFRMHLLSNFGASDARRLGAT
ncbi:MAG: hypothetical protein U1D55_00325 [Phycisphaerae bacterium]